jgi:N-acyl-D-aspartate/D-glutamate deacylase
VLRAVVAEARAQGLPVSGDLGAVTRWREAVEAGVTGLNHSHGYRYGFFPAELQPIREDEPYEVRKARWDLEIDKLVDPARPEMDSLFAAMAANDVALDPTLVVYDMPDSARIQLGIERAADPIRRMRTYQKLVRLAFESGVTLLAGTDDVILGRKDFGSLFDELEFYADAGIPNENVLRAATANAARWLGKLGDFGTVEAGKRADLVLIDGDPLKDIRDLRAIDLVVKNGRIVYASYGSRAEQ